MISGEWAHFWLSNRRVRCAFLVCRLIIDALPLGEGVGVFLSGVLWVDCPCICWLVGV